MGRWIEVLRADELAPGERRRVVAAERELALFNEGGEFFAIDDTCPHQGGSLGEGLFHDGRVICPLHSWVFDVRTGQCPRGTHEGVRTYPTRCTDGTVAVEIESDDI